ncbi:MAG: hypothetical protein NC293_12210, partial [Roseburia sp.]|nr:hypothetical protein [Roseburia sp.]
DADAAKKAKLSAKSVTVVKGKSKKVTIKIGKKNAKKKDVKKLSVKVDKKKIATAKASGKTAVKVTGKKKGSAKVTVSVTLKGQKKAAKLTLKVKVKNATPATAAPTTAPTAAPTSAATTTPAGNGGQGGGQGDGGQTQTTPPPIQTQAPAVESEAVAIKNIQLGGKNASQVTFFEVTDGSADLILNSNAKYGGVYLYFDVKAPSGSSIADIKKITYDIEGISGDLDYKTSNLVVGNPDPEAIGGFPEELDISAGPEYDGDKHRPEGYYGVKRLFQSASYGAKMTGVHSETVDFSVTELEDIEYTDTLRFTVHMNIDGMENSENTEYKLSNIKVYSTTGKTINDGNATKGTKIDNLDKLNPEPKVAFKNGSIAEGENTIAEVTLPNTRLVGDIQSVVWTSSDDTVATVTKDASDDTKAIVAAVESGKAEISAKVTTTKGKEATAKAEITVTKEALKDFPITLTAANTTMATGSTKTVTVSSGKAVVTAVSGKFDDAVAIELTLPEGKKISDYAGVQLDLSSEEADHDNGKGGTAGLNKYVIALLNPYNYPESNKNLYGNASIGEFGSYDGSIHQGTPATVTVPFDFSKLPADKPIPSSGKITLMLRVKDAYSFGITNVKLLAKLPAAE